MFTFHDDILPLSIVGLIEGILNSDTSRTRLVEAKAATNCKLRTACIKKAEKCISLLRAERGMQCNTFRAAARTTMLACSDCSFVGLNHFKSQISRLEGIIYKFLIACGKEWQLAYKHITTQTRVHCGKA